MARADRRGTHRRLPDGHVQEPGVRVDALPDDGQGVHQAVRLPQGEQDHPMREGAWDGEEMREMEEEGEGRRKEGRGEGKE